MADTSPRQAFSAALDTLVAQVQHDRSVLAALRCGSLANESARTRQRVTLGPMRG
jgi:hypothetical protein